jgi:hypothetical protein
VLFRNKASATAFITGLLALTDALGKALVGQVAANGRFATCCPTKRAGCIMPTGRWFRIASP